MKIISISFLNLNSLKGKHEIHFDKPPFTESGLFAITGPTGAGKTTILDAITVALYGKVHRHNKDVFEIMTRHTGESYAEVEFEVKDKLYRSRWSLRRSRGKADGQLQTPRMELADALTGAIIIEHPLNEVREAIVALCGLDYNQFLRSVMLSQGDFTRFLKADENERSELLEKITDTGIYSEISMAAYEKARVERTQLELLSAKLNDVPLLTAEERLAYTQELAGLLTTETVIRKQEVELRLKLEWLNNLERLEKRKQELLEQLAGHEVFYSSHKSDFEQLQQHQQALVYRPALAEIKAISAQIKTTEADLQALELVLPAYAKEESGTKEALAQAKKQTDITQQSLIDHEPVFETVIKKDILIDQASRKFETTAAALAAAKTGLELAQKVNAAVNTDLQKIQERIVILSGWLKENAGDLNLDKESILFGQYMQQAEALGLKINAFEQTQKNQRTEIAGSQQSVQEITKSIAAKEQELIEQRNTMARLTKQLEDTLAGNTPEGLEQELSAFPPLIHTAEQQVRLAGVYHKRQTEIALLTKNIAGQRQSSMLVQQSVERLAQEHTSATAALENLQQIYEMEVKARNYEQARLTLEPEKPCPLCGSVHHPYAENGHSGRVDETANRRNRQQANVQELKKSLDEQQLSWNTLTYQIASGIKIREDLETECSDTLAEFDRNNLILPKPLDIHKPEIIVAVIEKKKMQQQALQQQLKTARALQIQYSTLESLTHQHKEALAVLQNQLAQIRQAITFAEKQLSDARLEQQQAARESAILHAAATALLMPFQLIYMAEKAEPILQEMKDRFNRYSLSAQELNRLQPELRQKETELKNTAAIIEEKKEAVAQFTVQQNSERSDLQQMQEERIEIFGTKDPKEEREQMNAVLKRYRLQAEMLQGAMQQKQEQLRIAEARKAMLITNARSAEVLLAAQEETLLQEIGKKGLLSIAALNALFLPEAEAEGFDQLQKDAVQKIASNKSMIQALEKELAEEKEKSMTEELKDSLLQQVQDQDQQLSGLIEQKGKVGEVLSKDEQLKTKYEEVAKQIESQQMEYNRFQKLSLLIGSADGRKFSRFAQGLTLARLTELANRHLLRLSDRYSILKSPEKDLDLQIIDGYQADVTRPMSTLSGGESFLVSLALALGLSDLASRKVQINSLFIDEGFGTLDAETLDVAITALENLQANGKSIGIISHVEALKERIGTQIQIVKQPGGSSKITLHSYGNLIQI